VRSMASGRFGRPAFSPQEARFELLAMGAVVDPLTRGHDPFARGNGGSVAHHRHDITMAARPCAQDAETILSVVVGYSLDETCQHFPGVRLRAHADHLISGIRASCPFIDLASRREPCRPLWAPGFAIRLSELGANLLFYNGSNFSIFSECALNLLGN
jgi:hypothetical protein